MRTFTRFVALAALFCLSQHTFSQRVSAPTAGEFSPVGSLPENVTVADCDTIRYGFPIPGQAVLYTSLGWGFSSGHNDYGDLAFAERIGNINSFTQVFGVRFGFGQASASGPAAKVTVRIWPEVSNQPGTALYSQDLLIDDIIAANGNITVHFPSPVAVSGPFYAGYQVTYAPGDTVAVFTTRDSTIYPATAWSQFSNGDWYPYDDGTNSWGLQVAHAIYPLVLSGNFPVAALPNNPTIPSGGQVSLSASGGYDHHWYPATGLSCSVCPNPTASPTTTTTYQLVAWDSTHTCTVVAQTTVNVTVVGIDDALFDGLASIHPNPSTGKIVLEFNQPEPADLEITLTNALGQRVHHQMLPAFSGDFVDAIDLSDVAKGICVLQVTDGQRKFVARVLLQ